MGIDTIVVFLAGWAVVRLMNEVWRDWLLTEGRVCYSGALFQLVADSLRLILDKNLCAGYLKQHNAAVQE